MLKRPKLIVMLLLFCLLTGVINAQNQTNIWYFSANAGLDFNSGTPVPLTNGMINTTEGTACICDGNGVLLFYTDGVTVWDATHTVMPNGNGLFGNGSSSQSALIVKQPGNLNIYYLFTSDVYGAGNGTCYSVVDMSLNGGKGNVTIKNSQLLNSSTEKITAVNHANGNDIWVVTHELGNDSYYAYLLMATGLNPVPVVTNIGTTLTNAVTSIGYLKLSHDGSKIAVALRYENKFELFDFNNATGVLSNYVNFPATYNYAYGVEFSPNGNYLYTTNGLGPSNIYQFDLNAGSGTAIIASAYQVATTTGTIGAVQLATDGKIYVIGNYNSGDLDVINDPDQAGASCNYVANAVNLAGKTALLGLPNFNQSYLNTSFSVQNFCFGDSTMFTVAYNSTLAGTQWYFDDPGSGPDNISYLFNPAHYFTAPGTYNVQLIKYFISGNVDTVYTPITINATPVFNLGNDTTLCLGDSLLLVASSGAANYLWQNGSTDSTIIVNTTGTYFVTASSGSCMSTDSIDISFVSCNAPGVNFLSSDTNFCDKQCLDFTDLSLNNPTSWQWSFPGGVPSSSTDQNPLGICYNAFGSFDVTLVACNASGCDTLYMPGFINEYAVPPIPQVTYNGDTLFSTPAFTYQWYFNSTAIPGANNAYYVYQQPGDYFVIITDSNGCAASSLVVFTGTGDLINSNTSFSINPNPSDGTFTIAFNDISPSKIIEVKIYDLAGREVMAMSRETDSGNNLFPVNLSHQQEGIYFAGIYIDHFFVSTKKLVIIRK